MKIGELSRRTGLSTHTIRYYERIGLLPKADRDHAKQRDYDHDIIGWITFLGHMKAIGMPLAAMQHYASLREEGPATMAQRRMLLEAHRIKVRSHIAALQNNLTLLDAKISAYGVLEQEYALNQGGPDHDWNARYTTLAKS